MTVFVFSGRRSLIHSTLDVAVPSAWMVLGAATVPSRISGRRPRVPPVLLTVRDPQQREAAQGERVVHDRPMAQQRSDRLGAVAGDDEGRLV